MLLTGFFTVVVIVIVWRLIIKIITVLIVVAKLAFDLLPSSHHFVCISGRRVRHGFFGLNATDSVPARSTAPPATAHRWREAIAAVVVIVVNEVNVVRTMDEMLPRMEGWSACDNRICGDPCRRKW